MRAASRISSLTLLLPVTTSLAPTLRASVPSVILSALLSTQVYSLSSPATSGRFSQQRSFATSVRSTTTTIHRSMSTGSVDVQTSTTDTAHDKVICPVCLGEGQVRKRKRSKKNNTATLLDPCKHCQSSGLVYASDAIQNASSRRNQRDLVNPPDDFEVAIIGKS